LGPSAGFTPLFQYGNPGSSGGHYTKVGAGLAGAQATFSATLIPGPSCAIAIAAFK
jgi:hypothetical protein